MGPHSSLVEAARDYLGGDENAFGKGDIALIGERPDPAALMTFAGELIGEPEMRGMRPVIGRCWSGFQIPGVGTFDGVSFWLAHQDLCCLAWLEPTAIALLGFGNRVYIETIDQLTPELTRGPISSEPWRSRIAPALTPGAIRDLLRAAASTDTHLTRAEWETVAEFKEQAYEVVRPSEAPWRWNSEFYARVGSQRTQAAFST
ncbi:MAG: hypothetical protein EOP84_08790 [Verrucomicrobiaceae bacterium]|nr:MAG: hypothetical protein EOP84_08790 [Verrucomicrobiaceae bacterium]